MKGLIDIGVHFHEISRESWEGFEAGTKAAISGGVTTVFDFPTLGEPLTFDSNSLNIKAKATKDKLWADCGFIGGITKGNMDKIEELLENGVYGLKVFINTQVYYEFDAIGLPEVEKILFKLQDTEVPLFVFCEKATERHSYCRSP